MTKNKQLTYATKEFEVVMPGTDEIKVVTVNKLKNKLKKGSKTPKTKIKLAKQRGFFRGIEYTEQDTLLEYNNNEWEKFVTIKFGEGGEELFGAKKIDKVSALDQDDLALKKAVLEYK